MKTPRVPKDRASVLLFAVLVLAAGAFVLAGFAQLAATQAMVGQNEWEAVGRRVRLENSRSIARQFVLQRMFSTVISSSITFSGAAGGFSLTPVSGLGSGDYWTTLSTTNTNVSLKINPYTLMERGGFYRVVIPGTISDGTSDVPWNFQVRTRSPITAGYPMVQHKPANENVSSLAGTAPYIDMNNPEQFVGFHEMARMRVSSVTNTNASETSGYVGYLGVPIGVAAWGPFTNAQTAPRGTGFTNLEISIDLGPTNSSEYSVLVYDVPAFADYADTNSGTNYINVPVTAVKLQGAGGYYNPQPIQIVVQATNTNVQSLILAGNNPSTTGRPVYFNYQRAEGSGATLQVVTTNATGVWRIGMTATHSDIQFDGPVEIVGGIRTDGRVLGAAPTLRQELSPFGLDYIADRMMWLEDYKTP